jgi:hypothetical protein
MLSSVIAPDILDVDNKVHFIYTFPFNPCCCSRYDIEEEADSNSCRRSKFDKNYTKSIK